MSLSKHYNINSCLFFSIASLLASATLRSLTITLWWCLWWKSSWMNGWWLPLFLGMQIVSSVKMEVADTHYYYYYSLHYVECSDVLLGKQFPRWGMMAVGRGKWKIIRIYGIKWCKLKFVVLILKLAHFRHVSFPDTCEKGANVRREPQESLQPPEI